MILFKNKGSDCYLNTCIQALINIPYFVDGINENNNKITKLFNFTPNSYNESHLIKHKLSNLNNHASNMFNNEDQQDAHEAVLCILDIIHNSCLIENKKRENNNIKDKLHKLSIDSWDKNNELFGYSFINKHFTGQFRTVVKCIRCKNSSVTFTIFNDIIIQPKYDDVSNCINDFIDVEFLGESTCEKCNQKGLNKLVTIWKFPDILIISLNRFYYENGRPQRNDKRIELDEHIHFESSGNMYKYKLVSVINHHGLTPNKGHYTADVLKNNKWYKIDDDMYSETNIENPSKQAYVLFYLKI